MNPTLYHKLSLVIMALIIIIGLIGCLLNGDLIKMGGRKF